MLSKLTQIFLVVVLGILFALLFSVPVRKINLFYGRHLSFLRHKKKWRNILAVLSWYFFLLLFLFTLVFLFCYSICQYFSQISFSDFMEKVQLTTRKIITVFPFLNKIGIEKYLQSMLDGILSLPGVIARLAAAFMISVYLMLDWDFYLKKFADWKQEWLTPKNRHRLNLILMEIKSALFGYLKGQSLDSVLMGCLISLGLSLLRVPFGIAIGILAGAGNMIPYVGPVIAYSLTVFFCLLEEKKKILCFALLYLILIQQIDGSFFGPKLLGRQMQVRPLFVLLSILTGGTLFGPAGMLFAVPAAVIIKTTLRLLMKAGKTYNEQNRE